MTEQLPLVSVIVPVYNDADYLDASLGSLRAQTFGDFEVVVSDDGSTDASVGVAGRHLSQDSRFRLERNPRNLGMTRNWNAALDKAKGRYVAKLDADDALQPDALAELVSALRCHADAAAVFCRTISCDAHLRPTGSYRGERAFVLYGIEPLAERVERGYFWYRMAFDDCQLWHSNAFLIERERFVRMGGWDERWGCASDTDFILRVLEQNLPVVHCPYPGVLYRQRPGSVSDRYRSNRQLQVEGATVSLLSLARYKADGGPVKGRLALNWCRMWRNWTAGKDSFPADAAPCTPQARENAPGCRPTLPVMLAGRLWRLSQALDRGVSGYAGA